jgi:hypothetical protein
MLERDGRTAGGCTAGGLDYFTVGKQQGRERARERERERVM